MWTRVELEGRTPCTRQHATTATVLIPMSHTRHDQSRPWTRLFAVGIYKLRPRVPACGYRSVSVCSLVLSGTEYTIRYRSSPASGQKQSGPTCTVDTPARPRGRKAQDAGGKHRRVPYSTDPRFKLDFGPEVAIYF